MAPVSNLNTQLAFSLLENKGVFAVLLGSGVSRAAQIPTGWEITLDLIRRVAAAQGVSEQPRLDGVVSEAGTARTELFGAVRRVNVVAGGASIDSAQLH